MKKLFALIALAGVMAACNNKKKEEKKPDVSTTTTTTDPGTTTTTTTPVGGEGVPVFKDAEVQKFVNDYTAFVTAYVAAYKAKDYSKIGEVSKNVAEWGTKSLSVAQKLSANPQEAEAFSNYMTKLSEQMSAVMNMQ